jgi:eukaryotic-like serine/threonine-protein kinase
MNSTSVSATVTPEIGKYHLIAELARGGMGNVYLAVAQGPGGFHKLLVVKELRPEFAEDETYVAMFLEEARLAARLTHPNIVQTNEVGSDGTRHYMIMEYLDGRSLHRVHKHLARRGGFPVGAHLRVIAEALLGLHYAHELRAFDGEPLEVVHRDVSPLNVLVTFDGQAKVLDFGIAKAVDSSLETQAGILKGRIAYMAPEQARGNKCDRRVDVYAAGVMIWEAAAGRRLWHGMSDVEILTKTLGEGAPRLRAVNPAAPSDLDALCARALSIKPADRHPTAAALLADLDAHLHRRGDIMSMREVGTMVSEAFEPERKRMNAIIEDVMARMRGVTRSGVMPTLALQPLGAGTQTFSPLRQLADDLANVSSLLAATPSAQLIAEHSARSVSAVRTPRPGVPEVDGGYRRWWKQGAVGVAVGACVAFATFHHDLRGQAPDARASAPATALAVSPRSAPPAADPVPPPTTSAASVPIEARTSTTNPTIAPRWSPPVRWTAPAAPSPRAPKYEPAEPARSGSTTSDVPVGPIEAARPEVDPGGGRAPRRPIVTSNPYGTQ